MGWLLKLLGSSLVGVFGDSILKPILGHLDAKAAANRDMVVAQTGSDERRDIALVQGQIDANKLKATDRDKYWLLVWIIALPPAIHSGALYFDSWSWSLPVIGQHMVGSWNVVSPPGQYEKLQNDILTSFFYVAPALAAVKVVGAIGAAAVRR